MDKSEELISQVVQTREQATYNTQLLWAYLTKVVSEVKSTEK